ncbi:MAG: hypothetical protein ACI9NG_000346 [Hyphomonas sp.]|jgi:hypothetical protein
MQFDPREVSGCWHGDTSQLKKRGEPAIMLP